MKQQIATVLVALLLVTAGCSSGGGPGQSDEPSDGSSGDATGTINFYISDQPSAIGDFRHLNVTIDQVAFQRTGDAEEAESGDENASATPTETGADDGNATATPTEGEQSETESDGGWQTFDVDSRTVDLTELQGDNATLLQEFEVENGTYTQVRISVSDVNGTLTDGSSADVKLPSQKLRINHQFTVGSGESVDFVYDITVVKRGNSGSYNIKPVASESGTDVPIERVGAGGDEGDVEGGEDTDTPAGNESRGNQSAADQGRMNFYVSDEQNAIDDFRHLNVTVSKVGFQRGGESGNWTEYGVDNRTVDLTRLQGDNATLLRTFDLPAGNYTKVFIHVSDVNGTLTDGSSTDVKLPSEKLQLDENFAVGANESVDFVYDITVVERGNSGSYNIKPVASESGTDVPIKRVDAGDDADERSGEDRGADGNETTDEAPFDAAFVGDVTAGENATVAVTKNGTAVENATVTYDGTEYLTDADGNVTFAVPSDAEEVEVEIEYEGESVTLTERFDSESESDNETSTESGQQSGSSGGADSASGSDGGSGDQDTQTATATPTETASS